MEAGDRWLVGWGLGYVAVGAASLLIPLYALSLGGGPLLVGVLASTAAFAGVPGALLWGWLSARTGKRRVFVLVALVATAAVLAVTPLVRSAWVLVAANTLLWFVVSAASPVLNLLVVDGSPESAWEARIGTLGAWQGYGWVGGLVLGSAWIPLATRLTDPSTARAWLFWLCAFAAVAGAVIAARRLPLETTVDPERLSASPALLARLDRGAGRYVRSVPFATTRLYWALRSLGRGGPFVRLPRVLWAYLLAVGVFSAGFSAFWGPLPAYLAGTYPDERVFWFFLASNAASAVCFTRVGAWTTAYGGPRLQAGALSVRALLFPTVAFVVLVVGPPAELPLLLVVFGLIGLTWAVIGVTATGLVTRLSGPDRGTGLGLFAAVAGAGGGLGSILGGWLASAAGYLATFGVAGALVLASVLVVGLAVGGDRATPGRPAAGDRPG